jgi:hypothetical protein
MQNTTAKLLFLLIVTGALFVGCSRDDEKIEDADTKGSLEESVMGGLEEGNEESDLDDEADIDVDDEAATDDSATTDEGTPSSSGPATAPGSQGTSQEASAYVDGTYSAEGPYQSPAGQENMGITLVIKGGVVTSVSVSPKAEDPTSKQFQELFSSGISALVVGKSLDSLGSLGAVNGASLTPNGFEAAVATIKSLAQS